MPIEDNNEQTQKSSSENKQVVLFQLSDEEFGIDISRVLEIIKVPEYTTVPQTGSAIEGIINLRGKILAVMDLNKKLGFPQTSDEKEARIIVVEVGNEYVGLRVDMVKEVMTFDVNQMQQAPGLITKKMDAQFIEGIVLRTERKNGQEQQEGEGKEQLTIVINVDKILNSTDMSAMTTMVKAAKSGASSSSSTDQGASSDGQQTGQASEQSSGEQQSAGETAASSATGSEDTSATSTDSQSSSAESSSQASASGEAAAAQGSQESTSNTESATQASSGGASTGTDAGSQDTTNQAGTSETGQSQEDSQSAGSATQDDQKKQQSPVPPDQVDTSENSSS